MSRLAIFLAASALAVAAVIVFLLTTNRLDVAVEDETDSVPSTEETTTPESAADLTRSNTLGATADTTESAKPAVENDSAVVSTPPSASYVPGQFDAPEQLQVAVYGVVSEFQSKYVTFVDDMKCDSGNCRIVIKIAAKSGISSKASELMSSINSRLADNPLTSEVMVGVVSVSFSDNGDGRVEFVTMLRPKPDPSEQGSVS